MIKNRKIKSLHIMSALSLLAGSLIPITNCLASEENSLNQNSKKTFSMSGDIKESMNYSETDSDTDFLTRLRVQFQAEFTENIEVTARINAIKYYDSDYSDDDDIFVDRLYFSWSDIGDTPFHFSAGRLPTMGETRPAHLRLGLDHHNGTLSSFLDIALDGAAVGYSYQMPFSGKLEFYYASQFDDGYESKENNSGLVDTDIYGFKWEILQEETRSMSLQSFLISDIWNLPENITFPNPLELAAYSADPTFYDPTVSSRNLILDREILGDVYQTSLTYLDTLQNLNIFLNLGWSHTNPQNIDELGSSLLSSWWDDPSNEDGYCLYAGLRYNMDKLYSKVGMEFNYGSKYWINFSQNPETAKLATRGYVAEAYWTFEPPLPPSLSKCTQAIIGRIGYQYYDYEYTGSGSWLGAPVKIDDINNDPLLAHFYDPIDTEYKIYASIEIYF